jgi:acetylornithine deacetylase
MRLLKELIEIESFSGKYMGIIDCICRYIRNHLEADIILQKIDQNKSNVIVKIGEPKWVLNCHMDTVPPSDQWTRNPLEFGQEDGKYFGLGTTDTKGNIYTYIKAVERAKPKNIMLLFTVDEEKGTKTGVKYFLESDEKKGIQHAIVGEPTQLEFVTRHPGYYSFELVTNSSSGHSSKKEKGAIVKAAETIVKLHENDFQVGLIQGGVAGNMVSPSCSYRISKRGFFSHDEVLREVENVAIGSRIQSRFVGPALNNLHPCIENANTEVSFWTEAALFQEAGISSVVYGAGNIKQAHTADEFVLEDQLVKAQEKLMKVIEGL